MSLKGAARNLRKYQSGTALYIFALQSAFIQYIYKYNGRINQRRQAKYLRLISITKNPLRTRPDLWFNVLIATLSINIACTETYDF